MERAASGCGEHSCAVAECGAQVLPVAFANAVGVFRKTINGHSSLD